MILRTEDVNDLLEKMIAVKKLIRSVSTMLEDQWSLESAACDHRTTPHDEPSPECTCRTSAFLATHAKKVEILVETLFLGIVNK